MFLKQINLFYNASDDNLFYSCEAWRNIEPVITQYVLDNNLIENNEFDLEAFSRYASLTWVVVKDLDLDWNLLQFNRFLLRTGIPWDFIESSNTKWNWRQLSKNKGAFEIFKQYSRKDWDYMALSYSPGIDLEYILEHHRTKPWVWHELSKKCTKDIFESYPNVPWHYGVLSHNPRIATREITQKYASKPWNPLTFKRI